MSNPLRLQRMTNDRQAQQQLSCDERVEDYLEHLVAPLVGIVPFPERKAFRQEAHAHLDGLIREYLADGRDLSTATETALREFGEPWKVGQTFLEEWLQGTPHLRPSLLIRKATGTAFAWFGIASVLLLFPLFARVRERARQTTCVSNLRQLGQAFTLYAQDYDQRLPDPSIRRTLDDPNATAISSAWETYLSPYTKNKQINRCPSDLLSVPIKVPKTDITLFSSYATPFNVEGRSPAEMPNTAMTVLLVENRQFDDLTGSFWAVSQLGKKSFTPDEGVVYEQPDFRHHERGNYLFVDTHVKGMHGPNPPFPGYKTSPDGVAVCATGNPLPP